MTAVDQVARPRRTEEHGLRFGQQRLGAGRDADQEDAEHTVGQWLCLTGLPADAMRQILNDMMACKPGIMPTSISISPKHVTIDTKRMGLGTVTRKIIIPAFATFFEDRGLVKEAVSRTKVTTSPSRPGDRPHTIDHGRHEPPEIVMSWSGRTRDLMILGHEMAHALQLQFSDQRFMPPLAREVSAFLGELMLLDWAGRNESRLQAKLKAIWHRQNKRYLGDDARHLLAGLEDRSRRYDYRINYPLARLLAVAIFDSPDRSQIADLFANRRSAMSLLSLDQVLPLLPPRSGQLSPMTS